MPTKKAPQELAEELPRPPLPMFTERDAVEAYERWGANCGPAALACMTRMPLEQTRLYLVGFDAKRYTNPTMMFDALRSIGVRWSSRPGPGWPQYGLARIQWEGPWCDPGVPLRARYRYTHWVGSALSRGSRGIFDVNCLNNGTGWVELAEWERVMVPALAANYRRATGKYHVTHAIELRPRFTAADTEEPRR